ncbi:uracil-DNA glycosylase [Aquincola sp. S2]|uniref:Uracil-DNA glycosylase n=1 Tax=Pseudaquabacterium terrae TaxID=2732868 RepID=A0ABX2EB88_9BURK|nr:uracil-DNA glycosylase [Aquabacterium terrae]NRF66384.1 uracil-DNA glycosylase [Aquabacterium terrae]
MTVDNRLVEPLDAVLDRAPADWRPVIEAWRAGPAGRQLIEFVESRRRAGAVIYPAHVLAALERTPRAAVRAVILGQDPYHGAGQAEGLAFSVPAGVAVPPSLRNMLAELARDLGIPRSTGGHLGGWAEQGVLLLNTVLTVEDGQPASHAKRGWESLTDALIRTTATDPGGKVYLLWGAHAQAKAPLIDAAGGGRHQVLAANHPSPLSARRPPVPFLGCGHFGRAREFIAAQSGGGSGIDWGR